MSSITNTTDIEYNLAAVAADPNNTTAWLALADALEDDGQYDRAELTRLSTIIRTTEPGPERTAQERRLTELVLRRVQPCLPELKFKVEGVPFAFNMIPPGTYLMGSPDDEEGRYDDEGPQHWVHCPSFYMGVTQVTQAQWRAVMGNEPSHFKGDDLPVEQVSWENCQQFCKKLSEIIGREVRLPKEEEWEYACRAGTTTPYYTGRGEEALKLAGWYSGNSNRTTHPVGQLLPNAYGLYDMHGNVWEWCQDWYGPYKEGGPYPPFPESPPESDTRRGEDGVQVSTRGVGHRGDTEAAVQGSQEGEHATRFDAAGSRSQAGNLTEPFQRDSKRRLQREPSSQPLGLPDVGPHTATLGGGGVEVDSEEVAENRPFRPSGEVGGIPDRLELLSGSDTQLGVAEEQRLPGRVEAGDREVTPSEEVSRDQPFRDSTEGRGVAAPPSDVQVGSGSRGHQYVGGRRGGVESGSEEVSQRPFRESVQGMQLPDQQHRAGSVPLHSADSANVPSIWGEASGEEVTPRPFRPQPARGEHDAARLVAASGSVVEQRAEDGEGADEGNESSPSPVGELPSYPFRGDSGGQQHELHDHSSVGRQDQSVQGEGECAATNQPVAASSAGLEVPDEPFPGDLVQIRQARLYEQQLPELPVGGDIPSNLAGSVQHGGADSAACVCRGSGGTTSRMLLGK